MSQDDNVDDNGLTPQEQAFLGSTSEPRGFTPFEALPEPAQPPAGPAGASHAPRPAGAGGDDSETGDAAR